VGGENLETSSAAATAATAAAAVATAAAAAATAAASPRLEPRKIYMLYAICI
jgi:hypothetical protein